MSYNNYLDKVYTVGENDPDQRDNSSGDESDRDQRRGGQELYDAISDPPAALRNAMDPISEQVKSADLTQTPIPPLFTDRVTNVTTGTIPYNGQGQQTSQATLVPSRQVQQNASAIPVVDKFLTICTAFLATVPAIGLDEIKFKGSQQILHFTKLPESLNLPKDPQKVIESREWITFAEAFLNATGSTLAIFKAKKWSWEIKITPICFLKILH